MASEHLRELWRAAQRHSEDRTLPTGAAISVRVVKLANWDAPVRLERRSPDGQRAYGAEAARRWRKKHPETVKEQNARYYRENREAILARKKARRQGRGREEFLERARRNNRAYRERHPEAVRETARKSYAKHRVKIVLQMRAKRRAGVSPEFLATTEERFLRNQRAAEKRNATSGGRRFPAVPRSARP